MFLKIFIILGDGIGFKNTCTVSGKWNEDTGSVQDFIFHFCVWCKSRELGGRVIQRFSYVTPVMETSPQTFCEL